MGLVDHELMDKVKQGVRNGFKKLMTGGANRIIQDDVVQQVRNHEDPLVERCNHHLERVLERLDRRWQRRMMAAYGRFAIWVAFLDVAYRDQVIWFLDELTSDPKFQAALANADKKPPGEWYCNLHEYAEDETERAQGDTPTDTGLGTESFFHMGEKRKRLEQHQYKQQADEREEGNG